MIRYVLIFGSIGGVIIGGAMLIGFTLLATHAAALVRN